MAAKLQDSLINQLLARDGIIHTFQQNDRSKILELNKLKGLGQHWIESYFFKMGHSWSIFIYFSILYSNLQLADQIWALMGFQPQIYSIGINHSTD